MGTRGLLRPCADQAPPAVCYFYSPDRKAQHPHTHLKAFRGVLHADGYAGFKELYETKTLGEASAIQAACMAHVRRKFFDLTTSPAPVAEEALRRIGEFYDIEKSIRGSPPERRLAVRQAQSRAALCGLAKMAGRDPDRVAAQIRHCGGHPLTEPDLGFPQHPRAVRGMSQHVTVHVRLRLE